MAKSITYYLDKVEMLPTTYHDVLVFVQEYATESVGSMGILWHSLHARRFSWGADPSLAPDHAVLRLSTFSFERRSFSTSCADFNCRQSMSGTPTFMDGSVPWVQAVHYGRRHLPQ